MSIQKRTLSRNLARELTASELGKVSAGVTQKKVRTPVGPNGDEDYIYDY